MMLELELEGALLREVRDATSALDVDAEFLALWNPADVGRVKTTDGQAPITCLVSVDPRALASYAAQTPEFSVRIAIRSREELDPTLQGFAAFCSAVLDRLEKLTRTTDIETILACPSMDVCAVHLQGGDPPTFDAAKRTWSTVISVHVVAARI